jgi:NADPH-dependent 2,4-dienoyl-CoA reductase/sulfur reductase-like enzyme
MSNVSRFDVVIVGAGPGGVLAAHTAGQHTSSVAVIDQATHPGGQIWRKSMHGFSPKAERFITSALQRSTFVGRSTVIDAMTTGGHHRLFVERDGEAFTIETGTLILATGARELFLPFPGWTLPGVMGVGGLQAMVKSGYSVRGKRIVVAGSGPLLVAVAAAVAREGADVVAVVEQASLRTMVAFGARLAFNPLIAFDALKYLQELNGGVLQFGRWVTSASGSDRVEAVTVSDGVHASNLECDVLATGYGLVPNIELARRLGCEIGPDGVVVDHGMRTSVPGVLAVGECVGIAGVQAAFSEGIVAGLAAVGRFESSSVPGYFAHRSARRWGSVLARTFAPRAEVLSLARADTIICRCEDVRSRDIDPTWSARQAKLYSRAGMGACQGRVCGAALRCMYGWNSDTVRPPVQPAALSSLLGAS